MKHSISNWIKQNSLAAFFILAFLITWLLILPLILTAQNLIIASISPHWHFLGAFGPIGAAIIVTGIISGKEGIANFFHRLSLGHTNKSWFLIAVLSPVCLFILSMIILRISGLPWPAFGELISEDYANFPWVAGSLLSAIGYGIGEEAGWRGFALPRLQQKRSALSATFFLSVFWAAWHAPMFFYKFEFGVGQIWIFYGNVCWSGLVDILI